MINTEAKLKERIKELTCLYEVTSIIVNTDYDFMEASLMAIANCLKKAWQFESDAEVLLKSGNYQVMTYDFHSKMAVISSDIKVFNKVEGRIRIGYPTKQYSTADFLDEEKILLNNVSLAVGNLLERKQIRDREAAIKRQVERADRLTILGEITAGVAHELNTPLANILGFAELLKDKIKDDQSVQDLEKIIDNTIFSREIVKKLMFFACEMPQEKNILQLNPVVENVLKLLQPSLNEKRIKLISSFSHFDLKLKADIVQLTQVLFNLIMNAIYFSPMNGQINVQIMKIKKRIQIRISDEGSGINPTIEDKIFEPFFTTKPLKEGSGLGLSVVHGIINSHKGAISHQPNSPRGTIFTVDFPTL